MSMRRVRKATTRMVVSMAVMGMIAALAGCALVGSSAPDPAAPSPGRSSPDVTSPPDPAPGRPLPPSVDKTVVEAPPLGLDVRYVDEDGNFQVLRVRDFSR